MDTSNIPIDLSSQQTEDINVNSRKYIEAIYGRGKLEATGVTKMITYGR